MRVAPPDVRASGADEPDVLARVLAGRARCAEHLALEAGELAIIQTAADSSPKCADAPFALGCVPLPPRVAHAGGWRAGAKDQGTSCGVPLGAGTVRHTRSCRCRPGALRCARTGTGPISSRTGSTSQQGRSSCAPPATHVAGVVRSYNFPGIDSAAVTNAGYGMRYVAKIDLATRQTIWVRVVGAPAKSAAGIRRNTSPRMRPAGSLFMATAPPMWSPTRQHGLSANGWRIHDGDAEVCLSRQRFRRRHPSFACPRSGSPAGRRDRPGCSRQHLPDWQRRQRLANLPQCGVPDECRCNRLHRAVCPETRPDRADDALRHLPWLRGNAGGALRRGFRGVRSNGVRPGGRRGGQCRRGWSGRTGRAGNSGRAGLRVEDAEHLCSDRKGIRVARVRHQTQRVGVEHRFHRAAGWQLQGPGDERGVGLGGRGVRGRQDLFERLSDHP